MKTVYIGVGSNEGDRLYNLLTGIRLLGRRYPVVAVSSIYLTEAVGFDGRDFLNAVLLVLSGDNPFTMLEYLKHVERSLGRRTAGYGPRPFDADLLLYDGLTLLSSTLVLPHPRMYGRNFVLVPLLELVRSGYPSLGFRPKGEGEGKVKKVIDRMALRLERL